jgi:signal transduction histidine kinase
LLALLCGVVFTSVLIFSFRRLFELILDLTDLRHEVMDVINSYMLELSGKLLLVVLVYFVLNVIVSVVYTHRLVGPTVAFRRHIRALCDGLYNSRITLRKNDAFSEVAEDLNRLAEVLDKKG